METWLWITLAIIVLIAAGWYALQFEIVLWILIKIGFWIHRKLGWIGKGKYTKIENWLINNAEKGNLTSEQVGKLIGRTAGSVRQEKSRIKKIRLKIFRAVKR